MDIFKESIAEVCVYSPIFAEKSFCDFLNCNNRKRNKGYTNKKHHRRFPAYKNKHGKKRYRCKHSKEKLRQIFAEIKFKLVYTLNKNLKHL